MRKNSIKNTRINGEVQKELSTIIRNEIKDPRIHPMTSVMAVEVAPDLKTCRAYISVLGEKEAKEATIKGLNSAEGYIRRQLARNLNLRNTPEIRFILDESIEYGVNMSKLIDDVTKKDSNSHRQDEEQDETGDSMKLTSIQRFERVNHEEYCGDTGRSKDNGNRRTYPSGW